jgi:hypothetical protein
VTDVQALAASLRERVKGTGDAGPKGPAPKALTAARKNWNPLLHPRGGDGRFIEIDSWVRWLHRGFGSTRRGQVIDIIDNWDEGKPKEGTPDRVLARVEFPDRDGKTVVHDIPFDELEKVAPPKGTLKKAEEVVEDAIEKAPGDAEKVDDSEVVDAVKDVAVPDVETKNRAPWVETSEWAEALREAKEQYENWRESTLARDAEAETSLEAYLQWLEGRGVSAAVIASVRSEIRVRGPKSLLAHATSYWNEERRKDAAKKGYALPDGGYPIADVEDLKKAIHAYGRAKHPDTTKQHIMKRARALKKTDLIPEDWKGKTASGAQSTSKFRPTMPGAKASEAPAKSDTGSEADRLRGRVHGTD